MLANTTLSTILTSLISISFSSKSSNNKTLSTLLLPASGVDLISLVPTILLSSSLTNSPGIVKVFSDYILNTLSTVSTEPTAGIIEIVL